ncbi:hypothetical protein [Roseivirga echinicomitans]|uniref:Uncharacterized protein n=1 Tax=Roseivirga echinicomitans TaxID=296218 RepID=A0A150XVG4_9BACT|nr:hypothetical protein [Roseivirga echinicomitans]KYG82693.1 hypothetical protein AWN68_12945 [Roseivirga echinicomitans]
MKYTFTSLLLLGIFFTGCNSFDDQTNSVKTLNVENAVHRNLNKEASELLEDMESIVQSGLFKFEIYSIEGVLIEVLNNSSDLSSCFIKKFDPCRMSIKSVKVEGKFLIETAADLEL